MWVIAYFLKSKHAVEAANLKLLVNVILIQKRIVLRDWRFDHPVKETSVKVALSFVWDV